MTSTASPIALAVELTIIKPLMTALLLVLHLIIKIIIFLWKLQQLKGLEVEELVMETGITFAAEVIVEQLGLLRAQIPASLDHVLLKPSEVI